MSHVLHAYEVVVRRKNEGSERLLGNFDDQGADLLSVLISFFEDPGARVWVDEEQNAAVEVGQVYEPGDDNPRVIAAIIKAGESGVVSEIRGSSDGSIDAEIAFRRSRTHVEFVDVLLLASLPGSRTKGMIVSHSPSGRGVKTKFLDTFKTWLSERYPDYTLELNPTAPVDFYQQLAEEGQLRKVTLVRQLKPTDRTDQDEAAWFEEEDLGRMTTVIAPVGRRKSLRKNLVQDALSNRADRDGLLTLRGETYEEIRATFKRHGKEYSIVIGGDSMRVPRAGFDITARVEYDQDGHPTYESLRVAALEYLELLVGVVT